MVWFLPAIVIAAGKIVFPSLVHKLYTMAFYTKIDTGPWLQVFYCRATQEEKNAGLNADLAAKLRKFEAMDD